jgi:hypothetical protein
LRSSRVKDGYTSPNTLSLNHQPFLGYQITYQLSHTNALLVFIFGGDAAALTVAGALLSRVVIAAAW